MSTVTCDCLNFHDKTWEIEQSRITEDQTTALSRKLVGQWVKTAWDGILDGAWSVPASTSAA